MSEKEQNQHVMFNNKENEAGQQPNTAATLSLLQQPDSGVRTSVGPSCAGERLSLGVSVGNNDAHNGNGSAAAIKPLRYIKDKLRVPNITR